MNKDSYTNLKTQTHTAAELDALLRKINEALSSGLNQLINEKKKLYSYIYRSIDETAYQEKLENYTSESNNKIDNAAKNYIKYFETLYNDFCSVNPAISTCEEYSQLRKFPQIYTVFNNFFRYISITTHYVINNPNEKGLSYNIPLGFIPLFSAFTRVLYSNKKPDKLSLEAIIDELNTEIKDVIFNNFPIIHNNQQELISEYSLNLLYRQNIGLLYKILSVETDNNNILILPPIQNISINPYYRDLISDLRTTSNFTFFTVILESYWKVEWKKFKETPNAETVKKNYFYETQSCHLSLLDKGTEQKITNLLLDKFKSRFTIVSKTIEQIKRLYEKCNVPEDRNKNLKKISETAIKHLDQINDYNMEKLPSLYQKIYEYLTTFASSSEVLVTIPDEKYIYNYYSKLFYKTFGIYDNAVYNLKLITENSLLSEDEQYKLISEQIIPQIQNINQESLYNIFSNERYFINYIWCLKDIAPLMFSRDYIALRRLYDLFLNKLNKNIDSTEQIDLCSQFDDLTKNIIDHYPENDSLFPLIFSNLSGD